MSSTFTVALSGTTVAVDPFAFATLAISGSTTPSLSTVGVRIGGGALMRYANFPPGKASTAFVGVADSFVSDSSVPEKKIAAILSLLDALQVTEAPNRQPSTTISQPITSVPLVGPYLAIPSTIGERAVVVAMNAPSAKWEISTSHATYAYKQPQGTVEISIDSSVFSELTKLADDETIDVLLIMLAHAHKARGGKAEISTETLLKERCIRPKISRTDVKTYARGHRREDYLAISDRVAQLENLWMTLREVEITEKNGRRRKISEKSRVLVVTERVEERRNGGLPPRILGWRYILGEALRALGSDRQFSYLARRVLEYDTYRQKIEKRLARHYAFLHRIEQGRPVRRAIGNLIDECGIELNRRNPQKSRDRIEQAFERLVGDGIVASWRYTENLTLPARNWIEHWLKLKVEVVVADDNPMLKNDRRTAFQSVGQEDAGTLSGT